MSGSEYENYLKELGISEEEDPKLVEGIKKICNKLGDDTKKIIKDISKYTDHVELKQIISSLADISERTDKDKVLKSALCILCYDDPSLAASVALNIEGYVKFAADSEKKGVYKLSEVLSDSDVVSCVKDYDSKIGKSVLRGIAKSVPDFEKEKVKNAAKLMRSKNVKNFISKYENDYKIAEKIAEHLPYILSVCKNEEDVRKIFSRLDGKSAKEVLNSIKRVEDEISKRIKNEKVCS